MAVHPGGDELVAAAGDKRTGDDRRGTSARGVVGGGTKHRLQRWPEHLRRARGEPRARALHRPRHDRPAADSDRAHRRRPLDAGVADAPRRVRHRPRAEAGGDHAGGADRPAVHREGEGDRGRAA